MTRYIVLPAQVLVMLLLLISCQKEVDIDLNSTAPGIVIEGQITDQPGPYTVKISRTVNFNEPNTFPAVQGATVIINDSEGNAETLTETSPGVYTGNTLQGFPGRSYVLTVTAGGQNYSAVSVMPAPVAIDTITFKKRPFGSSDDEKLTEVEFADPAGIENYYRLIMFRNNIRQRDIYITSDRIVDGEIITATLFRDDDDGYDDVALTSGDLVRVQLLSIDKLTYEFLRTYDTPGGGDGSASPANPINNLSNGALGYFSAASVTEKTVVYP